MEWRELDRFIPKDHAKQVTAAYYIDQLARADPVPQVVVDLGCGSGGSLATFRHAIPDVRWIGVDVGDSQEAAARAPLAAPVVVFDGVRLPFRDGSVDLLYSRQVFEHVRHPEPLLAEIARVLRPGGWFAGSTSQLETFHSRSYWNYTVPGFTELLLDAGFEVDELRPGIDAFALIERAYTGRNAEFGRYFSEESPRNREIDEWAASEGLGIGARNHRKLRFCGQFAFLAHRPATAVVSARSSGRVPPVVRLARAARRRLGVRARGRAG
jgi:SAM-dependent methyltransferase